jgi:hypothetical protein
MSSVWKNILELSVGTVPFCYVAQAHNAPLYAPGGAAALDIMYCLEASNQGGNSPGLKLAEPRSIFHRYNRANPSTIAPQNGKRSMANKTAKLDERKGTYAQQ